MRDHTRRGRRPQQRTRRLARWLAAPTLAIAGVAVLGGPVDASPDLVPAENRQTLDVLRLRCEGIDRAAAAVACRWSEPDDAAAVKVLRTTVGSGNGRQTVFRTSDVSVTRFVDSPVRRGVRYLYVVRAFDADGRLIAASGPVAAGVAAAPDPVVEVLRIDCSSTGEVTVRCRWSSPDSPARVLTLWRLVDGGARERVASFANPFPSSYGDVVPASTSRAVYAVIATDGAGDIVARSRAVGVAFEADAVDDPPVIDRPVNRPVVAVDDVPSAPPTAPTPPPTVPRRDPASVPDPSTPIERPQTAIEPPQTSNESTPATTQPTGDTPVGPPVTDSRPVEDDEPSGSRRDDGPSDSRSRGPRDDVDRVGEQDRAG